MLRWLHPEEYVAPEDTNRGLRMLLYDGMFAQVMIVLTIGPFMVAFAVLLGASNLMVGILAAIGPLSQLLQLPAIFMVERLQMRKAITLVSAFIARGAWLFIALLPFLVPASAQLAVFMGLLVVFYAINAIASCSFSSWIRDLIPEDVMGDFFSKRMMLATATGAGISLLGAAGIDGLSEILGNERHAYGTVFLVGAVSGLAALIPLSRVPEPRMPHTPQEGVLQTLLKPFGDKNYRAFVIFLVLWCFATNLSGPFFTVYMLRRLQLNMTWILGFSVVSQVMNILFFRVWGNLVDRFNNRSIIAVSGPVFLLAFLVWPFTSAERPALSIALAMLFHVITGIASAGLALGANNLTYKTAPKGEATAYIAVNIITQSLASALAPILAGLAADTFERYEFTLTLNWARTTPRPAEFIVPAISLEGLDFLFVFSVIFGLYALHRLLAVQEEGETSSQEIRREFFAEIDRRVRQVSTVAGLRFFAVNSVGTLTRLFNKTDQAADASPPDDTPGF